MTPECWARVEELFDAAVALTAEGRSALLAGSGADADVIAEVESLLAEHDADPAFLDVVPRWLTGEPEPPPVRIDGYVILRQTGRGGMGTVYLAERDLGDIQQRVALKVLRAGIRTDLLAARFRAERRILARLEHPGIARLVDAGTTSAGLPFFAMEHVDGVPITTHADAAASSIAERVTLFRTVCDAVQHAHRNLIVHGDIKPAHVLVTPDGNVKLLDFGIARLLDPGEDSAEPGMRMLTPGYAAPEQIRGDGLTTACDVYGLGVLLYQLLTGRHPLGLDRPRAELEALVLNTDPAPPGVARSSGPDLDAIVLKAMRREPAGRYESALSLSEDLGRWLEGMPVLARPQTRRYLATRFARRHRTAVAAAVALFLVLTGSTAVTSWQARRIREESARVTSERDKALQVRNFLLEMFGTTGPDQPTGDVVTARQLLDRRAAAVAADSGSPGIRSEMMYVLAEGYEKLGLAAQAEPLAREALRLRRDAFGADHPDVVASLNLLGWVLQRRGEPEEAEALLRDAVATGMRIFPPAGDPLLARALNDLGVVREGRGDYPEASRLYTRALEMRRVLQGDAHLGTAITSSNLSVVLYRQGDLEGAARMAGAALDRLRRSVGPDHHRAMIVQNNLAAFQSARGDHAGAAQQHRDILERRRRTLGHRHPQVAWSLTMLANELVADARAGEAEPLLQEALDIQREVYDDSHLEIATTTRVLGDVHRAAGRHDRALASYQAAHTMTRGIVGGMHRNIAILLSRIGGERAALADSTGARRIWTEALRVAEATFGPDHATTASIRASMRTLH